MSLSGLAYEARVHGDRIRQQLDMLVASGSVVVATAPTGAAPSGGSNALRHIQAAKKAVDQALGGGGGGGGGGSSEMETRIVRLESENKSMKAEIKDLRQLFAQLSAKCNGAANGAAKAAAAPAPAAKAADDSDSEADLFGSSDEEENEEKEARKAKLLEAYAAKKAKKPGPIAKSSVIFDIKPWEAETDMAAMEASVRTIQMEGLTWGAAKLIPVAYGVKKLQIMSTVEDEKVSVDSLQEQIEQFEDFVQSVDIAAFNKI